MMKDWNIHIPDLPPEGEEIVLNVPPDKMRQRIGEDEPLTPVENLTGVLRVEPGRKGEIMVRGRVETRLSASCDRCLKAFSLPVGEDVTIIYRPAEDQEDLEELEAEDLNEAFYSGEDIDLWPVIAEHLVLGLPIKALCREDCPGLCPKCGRDLSESACQCEIEAGRPEFGALSAIRDKLPEK
jgi:uncharacterized protein